MKIKHLLQVIIWVLTGSFLVTSLILIWLIFVPVNLGDREANYIDIAPHTSIKTVASNLKEKRLIWSELAFVIYAKFGPSGGQIKPGYYQFSRNLSTAQIVDNLHLY